jgi:quercetin dioxygenase-like cupin family protein
MTFKDLSRIKSREIVPGFHAKFIHSKNVTIAYWDVEEGAILPEHSHPHEQVANLIEGIFEMTVGDETKIINQGEVTIIPSNMIHKGKAVTKCRIIDIFHPIREDYK